MIRRAAFAAILSLGLTACDDTADLRTAAERGDAQAQFRLALRYETGTGVPKDMGEAMKWHRKAAEQGDVSAQFYLGTLYEEGKGVARDHAKAVKWYRLAAEQGSLIAQSTLGTSSFCRPDQVYRGFAILSTWGMPSSPRMAPRPR